MKYLLLCTASLCVLVGCQKPVGDPPVLDGKELAERFIKPAGEQAVAGVVFNKEGDAIAVTADGKVLEPCRLPSPEGEPVQTSTNPKAAELKECHGTTNTSIYKISQISAVRHKGSNCMTFSTPVDGYIYTETFCW
jgi:hypothetical protein